MKTFLKKKSDDTSKRLYDRKSFQVHFPKNEPSLTQQQFTQECDVNFILEKYARTQQITHVNSIHGNFGDFSNVSDYQASLNSVMAANEAFMGLSASVRDRFRNDPGNLIAFLADDRNYEEALKLGLLSDDKAAAYLAKKQALNASSSSGGTKATSSSNDDLNNAKTSSKP